MKTKLLWFAYVVGLITVSIFILNVSISHLFGLGNPVIYDDNPIYGYRPLPNQEMIRLNGKRIKINNLGLRCNTDWDTLKENKILFLGNSVTYGGSYIDNDELFSTLVTKNTKQFIGASGGVNGWGIGNIHGLVIKNNFYPAKNYVSVLLEGDFHRGISTIGGNYFTTKKPYSAIHEVANHYLTKYLQSQNGHFTGDFIKNHRMKLLVQENSVRELKQIDDTLKLKGFKHTILISPSADQVFRNQPIDHELKNISKHYGLKFIYLVDDLKKEKLVEKDIFHDSVHLEAEGHKIWAKYISRYIQPLH
jgi:hypothetical protein